MNTHRITLFTLALLMMLAFSGIASAQDEVTLTLAGWASSPTEDEALQASIAAFEEANPNINVEFVTSPDHATTMQTAFASGNYANVFYIDSYLLPTWVNAGVVAPAGDNLESPEGFYQPLLDIFSVDGTLYCPPKDFSTLALQYNKDLFDAAGLDYPTNDWTWDDLRTAAAALTDTDTGVAGLVNPTDLPRMLAWLHGAGGGIFDAEGNFAFDSEANREAIQFYLDMAGEGIALPASSLDAGWGGEAFGEGKSAMALEGNWIIQFLQDNYPDLNWGVVEFPAGPAGEATMAFTVCYGVAVDNEYPEESWALVNFLTNEAGAMRVAESGFGVMPTRTSAAAAWLESRGDEYQAFVAGGAYSFPWQLPEGWQEFLDTFNASVQQAVEGQMNVDDVMFEVQSVGEELLSR